MEDLKIVKVESIKDEGNFSEGISYEQYNHIFDSEGVNHNIGSIKQESNFNEDFTYDQYNTIVIDSDEENDNAETIIPDIQENFNSVNMFYPIKVENPYDNLTEQVNIRSPEGNEFQECKYIPNVREDPLAFDPSGKSSVVEEKEDEAEYILPQTYRHFSDISCSLSVDNDQNKDNIREYVLTPTSSSSETVSTEANEDLKKWLNIKPKLQSMPDAGNPCIMRKRRINIVPKKKHTCSKCAASFTSIEELLEHIDTHAVGRLYFCQSLYDGNVFLNLPES